MNRNSESRVDISIVVPLFNESRNLPPLLEALDNALTGLDKTEVVSPRS